MAYFEKSKKEDIIYLYDKLKPEDVKELNILGYNPKTALDDCFNYSRVCYTIFHNKIPIGIFGFCDDEENKNIAKIGLLTTPKIKEIKIKLIKEANIFINSILKNYDYIYNIVHIKNTNSIKFLKVLGFKFISTIKIQNENFILFKKESSSC